MNEPHNQYPRSYGNYTLLETIGQGGMSAIELAHESVADANYMRFLIIKRMHAHLTDEDSSYVRMFQDEARITQELRHAKIAQVYNFGNVGQEYYLAMEYVPGVNLRELQQALAHKGRGLPIRITLKILVDILEALDYAHHRVDTFGQSMNIVHRDVNPRNVMLSIRGEVKLIDFGVAKSENRQDKTIGHAIKGKFAYMAPEQVDPKIGPVDGRTDLFAVGLMLYELIAGKRAFHQLTEVQIMHRLLSGEIPELPIAPDHPRPELLHSIYEQCISKDPHARFGTAGAVVNALNEAAEYCRGLASEQELAQFLQHSIGSKLNEITQRLNEYKTEHTGSVNEPTSLDSAGPNYGSYYPDSNDTYVPPLQPVYEDPQGSLVKSTVALFVGGFGVFTIGIVMMFWFGTTTSTTVSPTLTPTNITNKEVTEPKVDLRENEVPTLSNEEEIEITSEEESKTESTLALAVPTQNPNSTETSIAAINKASNRNAATTSSKELTAPPKQLDTTPDPQPIHSIILLVGTKKGVRNLPVTLDGTVITKTGSKKTVKLPEGNHKLTITDPNTGTEHHETIIVTKKGTIVVQFTNL